MQRGLPIETYFQSPLYAFRAYASLIVIYTPLAICQIAHSPPSRRLHSIGSRYPDPSNLLLTTEHQASLYLEKETNVYFLFRILVAIFPIRWALALVVPHGLWWNRDLSTTSLSNELGHLADDPLFDVIIYNSDQGKL